MLAHRTDRIFKKPGHILLAAVTGSIPLVALGIIKSLLLLPLYAVFYLLYAVLSVQAEAKIQEGMDGNRRATVMSFKGMLENLVGILMILASGYAGKTFGLSIIWIAAGLYVPLACLGIVVLFRARSSGKNRL